MHATRTRRLDRVRAVRGAAAFAMAGCLVASCTSAEETQVEPDNPTSVTATSPATSPDRSRSAPPQGSPDASERAVPTVPAVRDAAELARQLDAAGATVRDRRAPAAGVRRAGEFQQLAVRVLAGSPRGFRQKVVARLPAQTALVTRADVRAERALQSISSPVDTLPRWRVIEPRPPAELLGYYRDAQRRTGVHWSYLAAINLVETRMGRILGESSAGALGPMQFIPSTWDLYGAGGDINDPRDAIHAAARLLRDNGAPDDMGNALWHYNPSDAYVRAVSEYARTMRRSPSAFLAYWHWRVLYNHTRATYLLPVGYPETRAVLLEPDAACC